MAAVMCLMLGGCTLFTPVADLMSPPYFSRESEALHRAFRTAFGKDTQFRSPISGSYLSAFVVEDFDADGAQEALVFYVPDSLNKTVRIGVLQQEGSEWRRTDDEEGSGSDVYSVDIVDLDADGVKELVVCWTTPENTRVLAVYTCGGSPFGVTRIGDCTYTQMLLADLDGDTTVENPTIEILTIELISAAGVQTAQASVIRLTEKGLLILDKRYLDGKVSGYENLILCPKDTGSEIYIDAHKGETQMITELIIWNAQTQTMSLPLLDPQTQTNELTWRSEHIACRDLDGDGVPEIPCQRETLSGSEIWQNGVREETDLYITRWYTIRDGQMKPVRLSLVDVDSGFMFHIPEEWIGRFTVSVYRESAKWNFYEMNPRNGQWGDYLCSLIFTTTDQWQEKQKNIFAGYLPLCNEEGHMLIVYGINSESALGVSARRLQETFEYMR